MGVLYTIQSIISSASPALPASLLAIFPSRTILTILPSFSPLTAPPLIASFSALSSLPLSSLPGFLGEEVALDAERSMIAGVLFLLGSGVPGEGDFEDGQESFLANSDKSLLGGLININNFFFGDVDNLVQSLHLPPHHLSDPERPIHKFLCSLDSHEGFSLAEEEGEGAGDVSTWMRRVLP